MKRNSYLLFCLAAITPTGLAAGDVMTLDWESSLASSGDSFLPGQIIDDEYAEFGVSISAINHTGPDLAIIFDSANPTGGDWDLQTPGSHPSNTMPLGNILIIAENDHDLNGDGLIDDPDDEGSRPAGSILFDLAFNAYAVDVLLIDTEEVGSIDLFMNDQLIGSVVIPGIGNNAVQTVSYGGVWFNSMSVNLGGSGAIGAVEFTNVPAPAGLAALAFLPIAIRRRRRTT